ncbi:MAG TPA: hypothetical protein ENH15_01780, partial [Actinobacteria bacterium]|nr:hypothetical protein [Actinomycetota bacterium]
MNAESDAPPQTIAHTMYHCQPWASNSRLATARISLASDTIECASSRSTCEYLELSIREDFTTQSASFPKPVRSQTKGTARPHQGESQASLGCGPAVGIRFYLAFIPTPRRSDCPLRFGVVRQNEGMLPPLPEWAREPVESYLERLTSQRGLSVHSIDAYRRDLSQFFDFVDRNGVEAIDRVDRRVLRRYLGFLDTRGYARRSVARKASAARAFYRDAAKRGLVAANPADGLARPRLPRSLPHALPSGALAATLDAIDGDDPISLRDRALLETLYATGLRV